jgi:hypothetical protein
MSNAFGELPAGASRYAAANHGRRGLVVWAVARMVDHRPADRQAPSLSHLRTVRGAQTESRFAGDAIL